MTSDNVDNQIPTALNWPMISQAEVPFPAFQELDE